MYNRWPVQSEYQLSLIASKTKIESNNSSNRQSSKWHTIQILTIVSGEEKELIKNRSRRDCWVINLSLNLWSDRIVFFKDFQRALSSGHFRIILMCSRATLVTSIVQHRFNWQNRCRVYCCKSIIDLHLVTHIVRNNLFSDAGRGEEGSRGYAAAGANSYQSNANTILFTVSV